MKFDKFNKPVTNSQFDTIVVNKCEIIHTKSIKCNQNRFNKDTGFGYVIFSIMIWVCMVYITMWFDKLIYRPIINKALPFEAFLLINTIFTTIFIYGFMLFTKIL